MPVVQECMSGESPYPLYAFYDKSKDAKNNGWVWFHRELVFGEIVRFYRDHLQTYFGNGVPDGKGFVSFYDSLVLYEYFPVGKDDKRRDHWVLLLAWLPENVEITEAWKVLDNEIFQHVKSDKHTLPDQLSGCDYDPDIVKLTNTGAKVVVPSDKGRLYIEDIRKRGAVKITFYCERGGEATIETQKQSES
jgi:hypothetical protein